MSFGTKYGYVSLSGQRLPVHVDDKTLTKIAELPAGRDRIRPPAANRLRNHQVRRQRGGVMRFRAGVLVLAAPSALLLNRRPPG